MQRKDIKDVIWYDNQKKKEDKRRNVCRKLDICEVKREKMNIEFEWKM